MLGNPNAERALLEQTYDGMMTVTGTTKSIARGETIVRRDVILLENIPCALSFSGAEAGEQTDDRGKIGYTASIFCSPDIHVAAGSQITVEQYGKTYRFKYSGECAMYPTHQQISVTREDVA